MCYKDIEQKKNEEKLMKKIEENNMPLFIQLYLLNRKSQLGALKYFGVINSLLQWFIDKGIIKKNTISDIEPSDMQFIEAAYVNMYLKESQGNGISPTTLNTRKNIFRSFWKYMVISPNIPVENNIIVDVAYDGVASNNNRYTKMPTENDIKEMEENIKRKKRKDVFVRDRNLLILTILKETGIRECELKELELSCLFLDGDEYESAPFIRIMGKGVYNMEYARNVLLTKTAKDAFVKWLGIRDSRDNIVDKNAVFLTKTGNRISESDIYNIFKVYGKGKIKPHMMRHWYGTVATKEFDAAFAQQQLGHKSQNITINTYVDGGYGIREKLAYM